MPEFTSINKGKCDWSQKIRHKCWICLSIDPTAIDLESWIGENWVAVGAFLQLPQAHLFVFGPRRK